MPIQLVMLTITFIITRSKTFTRTNNPDRNPFTQPGKDIKRFLGSPYADANQLLSAASASGGITMVPIASTAPLMTSLPMSSTMSEYLLIIK